jgi:hypothetical protein
MPRRARLDVTGALYHITLRNINKGDPFVDDLGRKKLLDRLGRVMGRINFSFELVFPSLF